MTSRNRIDRFRRAAAVVTFAASLAAAVCIGLGISVLQCMGEEHRRLNSIPRSTIGQCVVFFAVGLGCGLVAAIGLKMGRRGPPSERGE